VTTLAGSESPILRGSATVWQDLDFPLIIRTTGTGTPALATLTGNITAPQWAVNDYLVLEGQELIHAWKEGSTIYWHIHLITNGLEGSAKYVAFEVEWAIANVNGTLTTMTTVQSGDLEIPASTTDKTMKLFSLGNNTLTGYRIGAHIYARLKRVATSGAAPSADPWVTMLQAHLECDTLGSREIASKT